ncbi:MAG: thiol reductant ABC exporter subunit CydC [Actinomycetaceae bacterium]|nr:thiol reductant ABC exporter subunit CydC [Actinomycetaceae bacterium]
MSVLPADERHAVRRAFRLLEVSKKQFAWAIISGACAIGAAVGLAAVSAWLIARASQMPLVMDLFIATVAVRFFGISKAVFRYITNLASHKVALFGMSTMRTRVYESLANSSTDVVTSVARGDLLARTGRDIDAVGDLVVRALQPAGVAILVSIISVSIVGALSPLTGLVLFLCLLAAGILGPYLAMRGARTAEQSHVQDRADLAANSLTLLESASELRVSGRVDAMNKAGQTIENRIFTNRDNAAKPNAIAAAIDVLATGISVVAAIIIGSAEVASGSLSPVAMAVIVLTPLAAFEATQTMSQAAIQLVRSAAAAQRILSLLDRAKTHQERTSTPDISDTDAGSADGLIASNLVIGWPDGPDVAGPLDLEIRPGQSLAIVGTSGIGKSTLLYTLSGMLSPHSGSVRLNGTEISTQPRETVSQDLILTAEDAHIFATTVLENIRVARGDVTEEEAIKLLEQAGLGQWISQLPDGVNTLLGSDASTISGGERRRLLLARALASRARYLLLDEPGEHLEGEMADRLIRDLLNSGKTDTENPRTVILVTHRLSPLDAADRVVVLSEEIGHTVVKAAGTHEELIELLPEYRWSISREKTRDSPLLQG